LRNYWDLTRKVTVHKSKRFALKIADVADAVVAAVAAAAAAAAAAVIVGS
jgi:hypothetical protein